jgi:hypothetical protein
MALPVFSVPVFTKPCGGIQASSWPVAFETSVIIASMNSKQIKTLAAIFAKPTTANLEWTRIESLLVAVGCSVIEGNGSRVKFCHGSTVASFHRPHPAKEAKAYQVEDARNFLILIGVTP